MAILVHHESGDEPGTGYLYLWILCD